MQRLQRPQHGFHIVFIHGFVTIARTHIDPATNALNKLFPFLGICHNIRAAHIAKSGQTVCCDDIFCLALLLFFNTVFRRQTVAIPPQFASNKTSLHRLISAYHILYGRYAQMPPMRQTISKGWSVKKRERMALLCLFQRFMKRVICAPKAEYFLLYCGKVCTWFGLWVCHLSLPFVCLNKNGRQCAPGQRAKARCRII